jgi:hypothetical protein
MALVDNAQSGYRLSQFVKTLDDITVKPYDTVKR